MSDATMYSALNDLLIQMGRSLLQYVGECWPWTEANTEQEHQTIDRLVRQQKTQVAQLANLLNESEWNTDYGTYPTEYTDLHYVALDFLLDQIIQNQRALVADAQATLSTCEGHPAALNLVYEIVKVQEAIAGELETLAKGRAEKA